MNIRLKKISDHRAALVARSSQQRMQFAQAVEPLRRPLALADKGVEAVRYIRKNPLLLAGAVIATAIWRPKGMLGWLQRGWGLWRMSLEMKRRISG